MKPADRSISACRHCQFYTSEGRRGGQCQVLNVSVQGSWTACTLAVAPFASTLTAPTLTAPTLIAPTLTADWRELEELIALKTPIEQLEADLNSTALVELPLSQPVYEAQA